MTTPWKSYGRDFVDIYDDLFAEDEGEFDVIRQALNLSSNQMPKCPTALDLGSGNGRLAGYLMSYGFSYTGIDLSSEMVASLKDKHGSNPAFETAVVADISDTYLDNESFDVILVWGLTMSLLDLDTQQRVIGQAHQHLKPGGRLIFQFARRSLFEQGFPQQAEFQFPRRHGGLIRAAGHRTGNWWQMTYSWTDSGVRKTAEDQVLLTDPEDYAPALKDAGLAHSSLSELGMLDPQIFGSSDVLVTMDPIHASMSGTVADHQP
ncbi:class I SAM-dependent methyltransferase [Rothia sp. HC945]|uniref:class I SAM-dependent methyltransferase n=1 Tax=Rothia sp. HC945 TaxID=3171170 RepID=UPI003F20EEA6